MRTTIALCVATVLSVFAANAMASNYYPGWYVGIQGGATLLNPTNDTLEPGSAGFHSRYKIGWLGGATLGYRFAMGLSLELEASHSQNNLNTVQFTSAPAPGNVVQDVSGKVKNNTLLANIWWDLNPDGWLHPYIGGGIGAARLEYNQPTTSFDTVTKLAYQGGVGIRFDLSKRWTAGVGYRFLTTKSPTYEDASHKIKSRYEENVVQASMQYTFWANKPDADGDGVTDDLDQCPYTPAGVKVDSNGCPFDADGDGVVDNKDKCPNTPSGTAVDSTGCPLDSDGDGVNDDKDQCPDTPTGVKVDATGCPLVTDSDGDGVPDKKDQCPNTPAGTQVMTNGCAAGQSVVLKGVNFELDKAVLTPGAQDVLDGVVKTLKDSPGFKVKIDGYTDSSGPAAHNMQLSRQRADSVRNYLTSHGIDASRLSTAGHGANNPIAPNDTKQGRTQNRRVELTPVND